MDTGMRGSLNLKYFLYMIKTTHFSDEPNLLISMSTFSCLLATFNKVSEKFSLFIFLFFNFVRCKDKSKKNAVQGFFYLSNQLELFD